MSTSSLHTPSSVSLSGPPSTAADPIAGGRARLLLSARWGRLTRWEFWPAPVVYALLTPHFLRLALAHRSLTVFTAANPAIPLGGIVGESKFDILRSLPADCTVPTAVLEPPQRAASASHPPAAAHASRLASLRTLMAARSWSFPLILKPDVGERGNGVERVRTDDEAAAYLARTSRRLLVQPYHPGPYEVGVFYVRHPDAPKGRIFSITQKRFPHVTGDGRSSLHALILRHPRFRLQHRVLLQQIGREAARVPEQGERVPLTIAGNHCRGTMFLDGAHLITPALEDRIDSIARHAPGFFFGRFDIRYSDPAAFAHGRDLAILEFNGVLSESTNIYDPAWSLRRGLNTLARQWTIACDIGAANVRRGIRPATVRQVLTAALGCRRE